ncbi:MAG TPA: tetratricopeptide repeat protein [Longimicrobium sp.]|nr:tetratricopeptide repeat protein [Longimicrobium sp.]
MRSRRLIPPVRRTARRWRTPPAILHGGEAFEGAAVLDEMEGPLGALLFQLARDVYVWGSTPPESREGLFEPGADDDLGALLRAADADPQLETALLALVRMTGAPEGTTDEQVALACQHVAHWADQNGHLETAIAFAQGAAVVMPAEAALSYAVGRLARRRAEYARAETWYRRAIALGRQSGDWATYSMAFGGLGNLYLQRGKLATSRRFHLRALRAARRHSMRGLHGSALHDLAVVASEAGQPQEAEKLARQAFEMYGPEHPRLVVLAADMAYFWIEGGRFRAALTVLQALVHHLQRREERVMAQANLVRAAAGAGERRLFEQTWDEVWDRMSRTQSLENAATVMLELAHGAAMLGEHERAERAAERAVQVARERGEARVLLTAESVLDQVRRSRGVKARAAAAEPAEPETAEGAQTFALDLVRTLNASLVAR